MPQQLTLRYFVSESQRFMRTLSLVISFVAVMAFCGGCGKKKATAATQAVQSSEASPPVDATSSQAQLDPNSPAVFATQPRAANAPVTPIVLSDPGNLEKTLADLTQALRKYSFENRRMPKSFSEVVAAGYVQPVPQPPPNKKFEIDQKTKCVVLKSQ